MLWDSYTTVTRNSPFNSCTSIFTSLHYEHFNKFVKLLNSFFLCNKLLIDFIFISSFIIGKLFENTRWWTNVQFDSAPRITEITGLMWFDSEMILQLAFREKVFMLISQFNEEKTTGCIEYFFLRQNACERRKMEN